MVKTQIVLPDELSEELKRTVPVRSRSRFIAEALEKQLQLMKFRRNLRRGAGAWSDRAHPDLHTQAGVNRYLARFRGRLRSGG